MRTPLRYELALNGAWLFPLDHAPSEPAGELAVGVRWSRRLGLVLRAGVAKPWRSSDSSGDSVASIDVRRIPIALLLAIDAHLRRGRIRVGVGPLLDVWLVTSRGVSEPHLTRLAQPALEARIAYRYDVKRAFFEAGVALDVALLRQELTVTGVGRLSHTPVADAAPFVGLGVTL